MSVSLGEAGVAGVVVGRHGRHMERRAFSSDFQALACLGPCLALSSNSSWFRVLGNTPLEPTYRTFKPSIPGTALPSSPSQPAEGPCRSPGILGSFHDRDLRESCHTS